ncbi:hypothetical protein O181_070163 [Austropuccinia psidii MF-1]|uniref:Uncharacterized protein n=1 Tax=Austropuccinia psidii MF-1 TaxID=1389203 RepID=A0A9Q3EYK2_9BASI|nr:hypothetical protein [Austropuccinia psidii MF-1]
MRPKGAKGEDLQPPNHKWDHLSLILAIIPEDPKMAKTPSKNPKRPKEPKPPNLPAMTMDPSIPPMASGSHQRPPASFFLSYGPRIAGTRNGAYMELYTSMHHFPSEIQWQKFQDSIPAFQVLSPVHQSILKGRLILLKLAMNGRIHKVIPGPQLPGFRVVGISLQDSSRGYLKRLLSIKKDPRHKEIPGQFNCSIQDVFRKHV